MAQSVSTFSTQHLEQHTTHLSEHSVNFDIQLYREWNDDEMFPKLGPQPPTPQHHPAYVPAVAALPTADYLEEMCSVN